MRQWVLLLLTFSLFSAVNSANALSNAERLYQFEIIIFSHVTAKGVGSEQWPWTATRYFPSQQNQQPGFLTRSDFKLNPEVRQLQKHQNYQVLMHFAWRQKIANPHNAKPIHIFGGHVYTDSGALINTVKNIRPPYNSEDIWQVNGTITPSLIRYIDVKFNLLFAQPISTLPSINRNSNNVHGKFAYFRLEQDRRMRSRELNYLSHPLYGVLVKVIPVGQK